MAEAGSQAPDILALEPPPQVLQQPAQPTQQAQQVVY